MSNKQVIVIGYRTENKKDDEEFGDFIKRLRQKYAKVLNTKTLLLLVIPDKPSDKVNEISEEVNQ